MKSPNGTITSIDGILGLSPIDRRELIKVTDRFPLKVPAEYLSLINWNDPDDPIRRYVIPSFDELEVDGKLDPSDEASNRISVDGRKIYGTQHKYGSTLLILVSEICAGFCRPCFRKRFFLTGMQPEVIKDEDIPKVLEYTREHTEIEDVLLTGGDALMAPISRLDAIMRGLGDIEHVGVVRFGTRVPVYNPLYILNNPELIGKLEEWSNKKQIYIMTHYVHPKEIRPSSLEVVDLFNDFGMKVFSQAPMIRGVNDDKDVLHELFKKLYFNGITAHYIFVCRPAKGNSAYAVPVEEGYNIFEQAQDPTSGIGKHARYVMSHRTGKIQVLGVQDGLVFMKYHREKTPEEKIMVFKSNPSAMWFDHYKGREIILPYRTLASMVNLKAG